MRARLMWRAVSLRQALLGNWRALASVTVLSLCMLLLASSRPFSPVFQALHSSSRLAAIASDLNDQRTDAARAYFSQRPKRTLQELQRMTGYNANNSFLLSASPSDPSTPTTTPTFTIVIITVSRKPPPNSNRSLGYVLQSTAALHSLVETHPLFRHASLLLCNVDRHPHNHADAALLRDHVAYVERYGGSVVPGLGRLPVPGSETLYRDVTQANSFDQERSDYTFCLQAALSLPAENYLVLQDDALPHPHFPAVLDLTLAKLTKDTRCRRHADTHPNGLWGGLFPPYPSCLADHPPYTSHSLPATPRLLSPSPKASWGYVKFYFPERWQGFALEGVRLLELVGLCCVGGGLGVVLHALLTVRRQASWEPSWRALCAGVLVTLVVCLLVGRQTMNEARRASRFLYRLQPSPRCCVPAMLYPAPVLPYLLTWLADSPPRTQVDLRISDFFTHHALPTYYIEPNVVRHVGMVTSLAKSYKKPAEEFLLFR